jgi:hypothetical protein
MVLALVRRLLLLPLLLCQLSHYLSHKVPELNSLCLNTRVDFIFLTVHLYDRTDMPPSQAHCEMTGVSLENMGKRKEGKSCCMY